MHVNFVSFSTLSEVFGTCDDCALKHCLKLGFRIHYNNLITRIMRHILNTKSHII